ncbi:MAG: hypothetical protein RR620_06630 [Clostridium sp.]
MKKYYMSTTKEVIEAMGADTYKGLLEYDCTLRREKFGDNEINLPFNGGTKGVIFKVLKQMYIYIALIAIIIFLSQSLYSLALILGGIIIINIAIKTIHEVKKVKELDILYNLNTSTVTVMREGIQRIIPAVELVKGDLVVVKKGSFIGADMRIIESQKLKVDEKNITGESFLKEKYETKIHNEVRSIGEIDNMLFRGTIVREGIGQAIVVETGNSTELGRLLSEYVDSNINKHTLYKKVEKAYSKTLICLILVQTILYLILPSYADVKNIIFAYSIFAVLSISLPLISMIYCKFIIRDSYNKGIDIRNISSVDLINDSKILFLNKYGSITQNKLNVEKIYTNEKIIDKKLVDIRDINVKRLLDISLLANNSRYGSESNWVKGDKFEISYAEFCADKRMFKSTIDSGNVRRFEVPFNSQKDVFTTLNKSKKGCRANSRGDLEEVIKRCSYILINGIEREINSKDIENIRICDLEFSKSGLITEGFAYRSFKYEPSQSENIESHMVFVGLMAHSNPIIEDVWDDIRECIKSGVLPILFTDDNKIVSENIARRIGLINSFEEVTSQGEITILNEKDALAKISKTRVFCRVSSEFKSKIIKLFKEDGYKLITEGEALGDLPNLSNGNVAISKGKATTILRNISDVYTNLSSLKVVSYLNELRQNIMKQVNATITTFSLIMLTQIVILNMYYGLERKIIFSSYSIIIMNLLVLTPILILTVLCGREIINTKALISKFIVFIASSALGLFAIPSELEFSLYIIIGVNLIIFTMLNSDISYRGFNRENEVLIYSILIFILGGGIIYISTKPVITTWIIFDIACIIIIYIIGEIIIKKWQE